MNDDERDYLRFLRSFPSNFPLERNSIAHMELPRSTYVRRRPFVTLAIPPCDRRKRDFVTAFHFNASTIYTMLQKEEI